MVLSGFGRPGPARSGLTARRSKSRSRFRTRLPPSSAQAERYRPGRPRTLGGFAASRFWRLVRALRCRVPSGAKKRDARSIVRGKYSSRPVKQRWADSTAGDDVEMVAKALARGASGRAAGCV